MLRQIKGIQIPKNKDRTKDKAIEASNPPEYLYFPMNMHIGAPADIAVKVGDRVKIGDKLGNQASFMSSNISSSVSGEVVEIKEMETLRGLSDVVVIKNDFKDDENLMPVLGSDMKVDDLVKRIEEAGIVGKGGAGFPTKVKYKNKKENVDYIIINGSECEGYSTTDYRVMLEHAEEIVLMLGEILEIYEAKACFIAVEYIYENAIAALETAIDKYQIENLKIHKLGTNYPQGHDGLQIREVIGVEIPNEKYPADLNIIQSNVSTIKAIYDAVYEGRHYSKRVMTISGEKLKEAKNLLVRIGTPVSHLLEECGGLEDGDIQFINGGPMMGKVFDNLDAPVEKNTTTILALNQPEVKPETACIKCGKCIDVCPMNLEPIMISRAYRNNEVYRGLELRSTSCISCGCCTYICPANIPLLKNIQNLNEKMRSQ